MILFFLSIIFLLFPILCYFLYLVYSKVFNKKEKQIFLDLALLSSFYLCLRSDGNPYFISLLLNIPIIIAINKKRYLINFILCFILGAFMIKMFDINIYVCLIHYLLLYCLCFFFCKKSVMVNILLNLFFYCLYHFSGNLNINYYGIFITWLSMIFILNMFIKIYLNVEKMVKINMETDELLREKKFLESLFKVTHEIKNPLAVCKGYLDMFDLNDKAKANRYIGVINQEINRTLTLLQDFSYISKMKIEKSLLDVELLLEDVIDEMRFVLQNRVVIKDKLLKKEVYIDGDYNRLKQVLINAIKNSAEAIEKKGNVVVKGYIKGNYYVIEIIDDGAGMNKETLDNIGTPFYTNKKNGTGLGVCLSKEIVENHNGTIRYKSQINKGTKLKITLPLKK